MIAILKTGGKQYKVTEGEVVEIERLPNAVGSSLDFDVLFVGDDEGTLVKVGTPTVPGAKVTAQVVEHSRGEKVSVIKFKAKVRYKRNHGHHQDHTKVKIEKITA